MIRAATPLDAAHFETIHRQCFEDSWAEESFRALLSDPQVFGLLSGENAIECCLIIRAVAEEAEILTLATMPQARRQGLASLLLEAAVGELEARGVRGFFLEVAEHNRPALALYAKYGFRTVGKRPNYYVLKHGPAIHALILRRDLKPEAAS
jgi:[ribosomal protein S18]-alanine N-acetyltransferase